MKNNMAYEKIIDTSMSEHKEANVFRKGDDVCYFSSGYQTTVTGVIDHVTNDMATVRHTGEFRKWRDVKIRCFALTKIRYIKQPTIEEKMHDMKNLINRLTKDFADYPTAFWAKRLDTVLHIPDKQSTNTGGGVLCGRYGALLGNNYAPYLKPVFCPECLKRAFFKKGDYVKAQLGSSAVTGFINEWNTSDTDVVDVSVAGKIRRFHYSYLSHIPTEKEVDVLKSFHLQGVGGTRFRVMKQEERVEFLENLIRKGWLNPVSLCELTPEGENVSKTILQS